MKIRKQDKKRNNKGFSLVELIVVIAIMAVLVAVLAPQFTKYVDRSRQSVDAQMVSSVVTAAQTGITDVTQYTIKEGTYTVKLMPTSSNNTVEGGDASDTTSKTELQKAIESICGPVTELNLTSNAFQKTGVTIQIKYENNQVKIDYSKTFKAYVDKSNPSTIADPYTSPSA